MSEGFLQNERLFKYMRRIQLAVLIAMLTSGAAQVPSQSTLARHGLPGGGLGAAPQVDPVTGLPMAAQPPAPKFDLNFEGGVPQELLAAIATATKERPNVVVHPQCAEAMIPPLQLQSVTAEQVFITLNTLHSPLFKDGEWRRVPLRDAEIWSLTPTPQAEPNQPHNSPAQGSFQQRLNQVVQGMTTAQPAKAARVFNLSAVLDDYSIDDVTTAISGAWDLMDGAKDTQIKFHKDTQLLIVVGSAGHLAIVQEVLNELRNNVVTKRARQNVATPPPPNSHQPEPAKK